MATVWTAIQLLIKYGPLVWEAIQEGRDEIVLTIKLRAFDKAVTKAEVEKDQRDLENQFDPDRHPKP